MGEVFPDSPGVKLPSQFTGFGRAMSNITRWPRLTRPCSSTAAGGDRFGVGDLGNHWIWMPGDQAC